MNDSSIPTHDIGPGADEPSPPNDGQGSRDPLLVANDLLTVIREHAAGAAEKSADIERGRVHAVSSRDMIDAQLAAIKEATQSFVSEVDSARAKISELLQMFNEATERSTQVLEIKAKADDAFQTMQSIVRVVESIKANAEQAQDVVATRSKYIEDARQHADEVRGQIETSRASSQQAAAEAQSQLESTRAVVEVIGEIRAGAQTLKAETASDAESVAKLKQESEIHTGTARKLAEIAAVTEAKIRAYETRLAELQETADARLSTIEGLLPGATSVGLASAFNARRVHFRAPQLVWQLIFVASLGGLVCVALSFAPSAEIVTWDQLTLSLLMRLPLALPLIWLAFHASHRAALAQRVEEDYAFKETVSRSFEGYRREMTELEGKAAPDSALDRLCGGVLAVITNPPGRIYEKHQLNKTPLNAAAESIIPLAESVSKLTKITLGLDAKLAQIAGDGPPGHV